MPTEAPTAPPPGPRSSLDPVRLAALWRRRRWLALAVVTFALTVGVSVATFMPRLYEAKVTVLVDRQQLHEHFVQPSVTNALDTRLQTISKEILSRSRLEALIERLDLYAGLRRRVSLEEVAERMRAAIKIELQSVDAKAQGQATVAFTLSYRTDEPHTAARVANVLASFYVDENLKSRARQASGTADFLRTQLTETKKRLDTQDQKVSAFRRRHLGALPEQLDTNLAMLERLHLQLRLNADSQTRALERRHALTGQLAEASALALPGAAEPPDARLTRLRQELAHLRTRFSPRYPDVVATATEVAELERQLAQARTTETRAPDPPPTPYVLRLREALSEVDAESKTLKSEEARLRADIGAYQQRVETTPQREHEFKELARDYQTTREVYQSLLKRNEEAQLAQRMEHHQKSEHFRILDPALPPGLPVVTRARLLTIATVLSLGLGVLAVVVAERTDTSFHGADDVRAFASAPLLVSIPWVMTTAHLARRRMRFGLALAVGGLGIAALVGASYAIAHDNEQLVWLISRGRS